MKLWDLSGSVGGPIKKDRVWYFVNVREEGSYRSVPGMYANINAGLAGKYTYVADLTRPASTAGSWRIGNALKVPIRRMIMRVDLPVVAGFRVTA